MNNNDLYIIPRDYFYQLLKQSGCNSKEFIRVYTIKVDETRFDNDVRKLIDSELDCKNYPFPYSIDKSLFLQNILAVSTYLEYCNKPLAGIVKDKNELILITHKNIQLTEDEKENLKSAKITLCRWEVSKISNKLLKKFFNNTYYRSIYLHSFRTIIERKSFHALKGMSVEKEAFSLRYKNFNYDVCIKPSKWSWDTEGIYLAFDAKKDINTPDTNILYWENLFKIILLIYWINNKNQNQDCEKERYEGDNIQS